MIRLSNRGLIWGVFMLSGFFTLMMIFPLIADAISPEEKHISFSRESGATLNFWTKDARVDFEGDCVTIDWDVQGIREIYLNNRETVGVSHDYPCVFSDHPVSFRIVFQDGESETYTFPFETIYPASVRIILVLVTGLSLLSGLILIGRKRLEYWMTGWREYLTVLMFAVLFVVAIDILTNSLDIVSLKWDHVYYIALAKFGYGKDNAFLAEPFIYRFGPLLARQMILHLGFSFQQAFTVIAYIGSVMQLWSIYLLARTIGSSRRIAFLALTIVGLSFFHLKFLIFDIYRPDHLAYPLMTLALVAILRRQWAIAILCLAGGVFFREFVVALVPALLGAIAWQTWKTRQWLQLLWGVAAVVMIGAALMLPRQYVSAEVSYQATTLDNWQETIPRLLKDERLRFNWLINLLSYTLPFFLMVTPHRLRTSLPYLRPYGWFFLLYLPVFSVMAFLGGGDLGRYLSYFWLVQVIVLVGLLRTEEISAVEIAYLLVAMLLLNRILWLIPVANRDVYLKFLFAHGNEAYPNRNFHLAEPLLYFVGMIILRYGIWAWQARAKRVAVQ